MSMTAPDTIPNVQSVIRDDGWQDFGVDQNHNPGNSQLNGNDNGDPVDHGGNINDDEEVETDQVNFAPLTYQSVKANCDKMCRYVQNDQLQLAELKLLTDRILSRLRNRQNIHASFIEDVPLSQGVPLSQADQTFLPKSAVGKIVSNAGSMKRKRSRQEHFHMNRAKKAQPSIAVVIPSNLSGNDAHHLPLPRLDQRACSFCKKKRHFVGKCPTLLQYGVAPLVDKDDQSRSKLQAELTAPVFITSSRDLTDERTVFTTLPQGIGALIIFKRFFIQNLLPNDQLGNYCVECTIHTNNGDVHDRYNRSLFVVACVAKYVVKSTTNRIVSLLQYTTQVTETPQLPPTHFTNNFQTMGHFPHAPNNYIYTQLSQQLSQQPMSQHGSQPPFGYDFTNQSGPL
jgi:hypothetical protein